MASEDTRPKVRMLLTIGVVSVSLLIGVKFVLDSYYLDMTEGYEHSLLPKTELLDQTRAEQRAALDKGENGNIPVSVAMQTLASKGRDNASPVIVAQPSDDVGPLEGWAKLKHEVHLPPQVTTSTSLFAPPPAPDAGPGTNIGVAIVDGGVPSATDAGAPRDAKDAGVHGLHAPPPNAPQTPPQGPKAPQGPKDGGP